MFLVYLKDFSKQALEQLESTLGTWVVGIWHWKKMVLSSLLSVCGKNSLQKRVLNKHFYHL